MSRWPPKYTEAKINANTNTVNIADGMSLAEADAILAKFGYADRAEVAVA